MAQTCPTKGTKRTLIQRRRKCIVGRRQMYRRVCEDVGDILTGLFQVTTNNFNLDNLDKNNVHTSDCSNNYLPQPITENYENLENSVVECNSSDSSLSENNNLCELIQSDYNQYENPSDNDFCKAFKSWVVPWSVQHNIPNNAVTDMLHFLSKYHSELPFDSRTLLKTPRKRSIIKLTNGEFCYLGLACNLKILLSDNNAHFPEVLEISFNIDGIPLFHSTNSQFWPILGLLKNVPSNPFVIGIFCGTSKPNPLSMFLNLFVTELNELQVNGFIFKNKKHFVKIHSIVCDAPARAYIKSTKSHTGYSSCDRCTIVGDYKTGRVVFDSCSYELRTDSSFRNQLDEDHHVGTSPLLKLNIDLIHDFPIDYMHCICLGVMRKFLVTLISGPLHIRLGKQCIEQISKQLLLLRTYIPFEFNRKPRALSELSRWKATELRMFLLYLGPLVLKDVLDNAIYQNFLLLHISTTILISPQHCSDLLDIAKELLNIFIEHSKSIYGSEFLSYNVHMLSHICDDVKKYGSLDNISSFPFENYLGKLKKLVKSPNRPLAQIVNRLQESKELQICCKEAKISFLMEHFSGPLPNNGKSYKQYKKIVLNDFCLSNFSYSPANAYCIINKVLIQVDNILLDLSDDKIFFFGKEMSPTSSFFTEPVDSNILGISKFIFHKVDRILWPVKNSSITKCIVFKNEQEYISMPLKHLF